MTTTGDIRLWLEEGIRLGATHVLIVCDTFTYEDDPVYVMPDEIPKRVHEEISSMAMTKVMEIYDLSKDLETQLAQKRAWSL